MRQTILILTLIWWLLPAQAQQADFRKMSNLVRQVTSEQQRNMTRGAVSGGKRRSMTAFVRTHRGAGDDVLSRHGCRTYAQWGDIAIVEIPLDRLASLSAEPAVRRIEASRPASLHMDTTTTIVRALPVYEPAVDHQAYTGRGVVVGVVDVGFDLTHPTFYDTQANNYRIGAFWDQLSKDTIGSQLPVGRDYIGGETVRAIGSSTDAPILTHGTHTAGIAAGSGYDTPYRGIAYDSDICLVANAISTNVEYVDSADYYNYTTAVDALGFKYCMDYADHQGKPCVVSLSEGYSPYLDEEDSLYAEVLDSLSGPGHIIVSSAGNGGIEKSYFEKSAEPPEAGAFIRCFQENGLYKIKSGGPLQLRLYYYGKAGDAPTDTLVFETAEVPLDTILSKSLVCDGDSLKLSVYRDISRFDDDDIWQILLAGNRTLDQLMPMALVVAGTSRVEVYGSSTYAFKDHEADSRWMAARKGHDINAPSCFPAVISVGATAHRMRMLNETGEVADGIYQTTPGTVWEYSSTGPSMNGLTKPEVVAPGVNVVSSYSHIYHPERHIVATSEFQGERYFWGAESGTSMSAPVVAGIIALWLQAKPDLTPDEVRQVISRSCRQPETGMTYPNNTYGYGEIDAYRGLLEVLGLTGIEGLSLHQAKGVQIRPTEGGIRLSFEQTVKEPIAIKVYGLDGVCVSQARIDVDGQQALVTFDKRLTGIHAVQIEGRTVRGSSLVRL